LGANSKGYDVTMKGKVKDHLLKIRSILRSERISSKRVS